MLCIICYENIYMPYFKYSCKCKSYYHINCINKLSNTNCILCKKKDNLFNDNLLKLQNIHNKIYNFIILYFSLIIIIIYLVL
jgi:hypothetical protein